MSVAVAALAPIHKRSLDKLTMNKQESSKLVTVKVRKPTRDQLNQLGLENAVRGKALPLSLVIQRLIDHHQGQPIVPAEEVKQPIEEAILDAVYVWLSNSEPQVTRPYNEKLLGISGKQSGEFLKIRESLEKARAPRRRA